MDPTVMKSRLYYCSLVLLMSVQAPGEDSKNVNWDGPTNNVQIFLPAIHVIADSSENENWGALTNDVQMSISLEDVETQVRPNQPFSLLVQIRSASTNEISYFMQAFVDNADPVDGLSLDVTAPSGKDISPKYKGDSGVGSVRTVRIRPNQTVKFKFALSRLASFSQIGTYKVLAKKVVTSPDGKRSFTVISNPLLVSVVPGIWTNQTTKLPVGF